MAYGRRSGSRTSGVLTHIRRGHPRAQQLDDPRSLRAVGGPTALTGTRAQATACPCASRPRARGASHGLACAPRRRDASDGARRDRAAVGIVLAPQYSLRSSPSRRTRRSGPPSSLEVFPVARRSGFVGSSPGDSAKLCAGRDSNPASLPPTGVPRARSIRRPVERRLRNHATSWRRARGADGRFAFKEGRTDESGRPHVPSDRVDRRRRRAGS